MIRPLIALVLSAGAVFAQPYPVNMTPAEAHKLTKEKKIVLVDIRRPDEWAETGVAEGALRIDMNDPMFAAKISQAQGGDRTMPLALICRTANRTRTVQQALMQQGYPVVINVEGGMIGNRDDAGWIRRGLPMAKAE
ncbi:MAG: rhodanese-like domain-containing protein [Beijerinckiaceae bacterium]